MITVNNISFAYGKTQVLHDIAFTVSPGQVCAILGANGSGKTTLLKCMLGMLTIDGGEVFIGKQNMNGISPRKRARLAAYVPQDTRQYGDGSVFETVLLGRKPFFGAFPGSSDYEMTAKVLTELQLDTLAMRPVNTLSGGQRQRVCIAKALCQDTPVILLDEPTANLDLRYKVQVMQLLQSIADSGKTVITTVHDLNIARAFCSQHILLKSGHVITDGGTNVLNWHNIEQLYDVDYDQVSALFSGLPGPVTLTLPVCNSMNDYFSNH